MQLADCKVLVADDHLLMRQMLGTLLRNHGCTAVDFAVNGTDTLEKIHNTGDTGRLYDIVLLDWLMPQLNGIEVLRACRSDKRYDDMAMVIVTAESEKNNLLSVHELGATACIIKPFEASLFIKKMAETVRWCERRKNIV